MKRPLWTLDDASREAVLGVCLSVDLLRRIADAEAVRTDVMSDYALHMAVVLACAEENALSRAVQAMLVEEHATTAARFAREAHDDAQLLALWKLEAGTGHCARALWACMTHGHCNARVRERVLQDLRMVQYRALAGARADMERARCLAVENRALVHFLARIQQRHSDWQRQRDTERRQMQGELARLRRAVAQGPGMPGGAPAAA